MSRNNQTLISTSFYHKIALMLLGVVLTIVILEAGLRLGGVVLSSIQEYRNRISISQRGTYRILCLGESTTARQYPSFLEEILNRRNIGIKFSVIDKGIDATTTDVILSKLESNLDAYHPDMVITMMGINDFGPNMPDEAFFSDSKVINFLKSFRTYKLARLLWLHIVARLKDSNRLKFFLRRSELQQMYAEDEDISSNGTSSKYKKAIELNPKNDWTYINLGNSYRDLGKLSKADELYRKAIEFNPNNSVAYLKLGNSYCEQGKFSEAEGLYKKAIELNSKNDQAYVGLGKAYNDQRKFLEAEKSFKKAMELNPQNDWAHIRLGRLFYQGQGKFLEAEKSFEKAIEVNHKNEWAYFELGKFYQSQKKFPEAEKSFKKAIEVNPRSDWAYGALVVLSIEMGNSELASEYGEKVKKLRASYYNPTTIGNYCKLKAILEKRGITYVCVQYPMRSLEPLRKIFVTNAKGIIFVGNEKLFKVALKKASYQEYFRDRFRSDFGHCTEKGNRLLAKNIADTILKEAFHK